MQAKSLMLLTFLWLTGCAAGATPAKVVAQDDTARRVAPASLATDEPARAVPATPAATLAEADRAYDARLAASRGQFDTERQIAVLREAVLLYGQFLERAEGRPELEPAVRKSRERIIDANATIEFLLASLNPEPPLAPTP
jgi:hypothetical protein